MAQKNRTKEIWLIPKRVNLHQTICLIDGVIDRNYNNTAWNPQKQNNLGVNLKNWGATKDGKNISQQAIRTLVASIPQYLGFLYINTESTPNTICLTNAGLALWDKHKEELVKIPNLVAGKSEIITKSELVLKQMEKLQITNPIINKDCENICLFPFRFMLKVLQKIQYIDQEEIAYFLFKSRAEDEVDLVVQEILNFRKISSYDREKLINEFKKTHIGNITLVKAPSSGYYMSLCQITGIIDKITITPDNKSKPLSALRINSNFIEYVQEIIYEKYNGVDTFDYGDDLGLWIDYIGEPNRDFPPICVFIENKTNKDYLIQVCKDNYCRYDDLLFSNDKASFPMFPNEEYVVKIIDTDTGEILENLQIYPSLEQRQYEINGEFSEISIQEDSIESVSKDIIDHCDSQTLSGKTLNYLNTLSKTIGIDKTRDKSLRGAYFEYYFFKLLSLLKEEDVIDDVFWNGKIGKYGLPTQAPGGKTGTPDLVFTIDNLHFVLELTTIKAKSTQFSAEGSSVPDHIRLYKDNSKAEVVGLFCAPIIHERNTAAMKSTISHYNIKLNCVTEKELVKVFLSKDRNIIKNSLS